MPTIRETCPSLCDACHGTADRGEHRQAAGASAQDLAHRRGFKLTLAVPRSWTAFYFSILIVRVVIAPHFLQAYVKSHRSVSSEMATGGDGVIGRLQPGQVTVG